MKKLLKSMMAMFMVVGLVGCGDKQDTPTSNETETANTTETAETSKPEEVVEEEVTPEDEIVEWDENYVVEYNEDGKLSLVIPVTYLEQFGEIGDRRGTVNEYYETSFKTKTPLEDGSIVTEFTTGGPITIEIPKETVEAFDAQMKEICELMKQVFEDTDDVKVTFDVPYNVFTITCDEDVAEVIEKEMDQVFTPEVAMNFEYYELIHGVKTPKFVTKIVDAKTKKKLYKKVF